MSGEAGLPESVQTIPEALAFWAERTPAAPALIVAGASAISYATLWRRALILAETLHRAGIGRHDRVVLLIPEGPALTAAFLGVAAVAIAVPLPASLTPAELRVALDGLGAAAALVAPTVGAKASACLRESGTSIVELDEVGGPRPCALPGREIPGATPLAWPDPQDIALICQTSGTTGRPKRVPRTHLGKIQSGKYFRDQYGILPTDRAPALAPLTLSLGQTVLAQVLASGSALIYPPATEFGRQWEIIEGEHPTWMSVASGYLELLVRYLAARPPRTEPSSLRYVMVTSAPISPATCEMLERQLGAPVYPRYSSSEAGRIAETLPPPAPKAKPGSVGRPVQEVQIVDAEGNVVSPGVMGEIWVRGPRVVPGYVDDPEATAAAFLPGGWYRTGDVGYFDDDGFLFLTGRLNEMINRGGEKIAPPEVDQVLLSHPAVSAAAVFAVPDARLGQDIVAAVVLKDGQTSTPRQLRRWMLNRLSPHKAPRRIWFLDALPLTPSGKVQRGELARRWQEERK